MVLKMSHRFFYIYEVKGDINEKAFNESPIEIDGSNFNLKLEETKTVESFISPYYFNNQKEIRGNIIFNDEPIPFTLRSKSKLIFVETSYQWEKLKILKFFNTKFKEFEIDLFIPTNEEEKDFVCNTTEISDFKVFIDNEIVHRSETKKELCDGLMSDMELIEATLDLTIKNKKITFYYYGSAIQFPHPKEEEIEVVIQSFENAMMAPAK